MVQRSPFGFCWDRFTFNHFHGFCKDILNEFGETGFRTQERSIITMLETVFEMAK
jgi:hypothetical protein